MNYKRFGYEVASELVLDGAITISEARLVCRLALKCSGFDSDEAAIRRTEFIEGMSEALSLPVERVEIEP